MKFTIPTTVFVALSIAIAGCRIGPSTGAVEESMDPAGIRVQVYLTNNRAPGGELLTVSSDEIGVLTTRGVAIIPAALIDRLTGDDVRGSVRTRAGQIPADDVAVLRPLSRFPAGFPSGVLDVLIEIHGSFDVTPERGGSS